MADIAPTLDSKAGEDLGRVLILVPLASFSSTCRGCLHGLLNAA